MSSTARILKFPKRFRGGLSESDAFAAAERCLETPFEQRDPEDLNPDLLLAMCEILRSRSNVEPSLVFEEATYLHGAILDSGEQVGLFDECDYFLGELCLLAGIAATQLGNAAESDLWLDRADAAFRHVINSAPLLANVCFARLALRYTLHRHREVIERVPGLVKSYQALGMHREVAKCQYLEAMSLKHVGRRQESLSRLECLETNPIAAEEPAVLGQTLVELGGYYATDGCLERAMTYYQRALTTLSRANRPIAMAHLRWTIGETLRREGQLGEALDVFKECHRDFAALKMSNYVTLLHLTIAETLLAMDRSREAEWEILAALPTIEEQKMVPEGFAAVALLKESVRRRKTDPNALRELREHLQANQ